MHHLLIFYQFMDDDLLNLLIEYNILDDVKDKLPPLFRKYNDSRKLGDIQFAQRKKLIQYYAIRFAITSNYKSSLADMFPFKIDGYDEFSMTIKEFSNINNNFRFPIQLVKELNNRFNNMINTSGRIVCTDEKHREVQIGWKHSRYAKNKNGHWITESTILGPTTALPLFVLLQPTTTVNIKSYDQEPYNNIPVNELLLNIVNISNDLSIHIADSYYPDTLGMRELATKGSLYLFKVSKKRFKELFDKADVIMKQKGLTKINDFVVLYSEETEQYFMVYVSEKVANKEHKKKGVLTNAFTHVKASPNYIGPNTISIAFQEYFNQCDRANSRINSFGWPFRRNGWESSYDDFFFQTILLNIYTCYHEARGLIGEANHLGPTSFLESLAKELLDSIRS
jgi:hypothetical protein